MYIYPVPIPLASEDKKEALTELVDQVLVTKKPDPNADVSRQEAEIDQLVYSLYGLSREEIAIIEDSLQERAANREVGDASALEHPE
ncbi:MAG: hypothetical protein ACREQA_18555 [Candidatus Binatia bacterium]